MIVAHGQRIAVVDGDDNGTDFVGVDMIWPYEKSDDAGEE